MKILINKLEHIQYTPEQLEERRKQKQEMIDSAYKRKANEVHRAAEMQHIPGQPIKMGGPGSRIQDWEITSFDKADIDKAFPELIKESKWYYDGIYKNDTLHPELDLYLYGDEDRFIFSKEEYNCIVKYLPNAYNQDDVKRAKEKYKREFCTKYIMKEIKPKIEKNWSYTIKEGEHAGKTLWSGRYCAVTGIVYCKVNFIHNNYCDIYVLAEKRGKGTPDFQGHWCLPCGFLEADESGQAGIARETLEETGITVNKKVFKLIGVQTDPRKSNKGHVTLRYAAELESMDTPNYKNINGENDEVADVRWINLNSIDTYKWAFGHDELLKNYFSKQDYLIRHFDKKPKIELLNSELL